MRRAHRARLSILLGINLMFGVGGWSAPVEFHQADGQTARCKIEPGSRLMVRAADGSVEVTGWDGDELEASAERDDEPAPIEIRREANGVYVISSAFGRRRSELESRTLTGGRSPGLYGGGFASAERVIRLKVPYGIEIKEISVGSADIELSNLKSAVGVTTTSGDVAATNLGDVSIKTASGDIEANRVGKLFVRTSSGDLEANGVAGDFDMQTSSGDATVTSVKGSVTFQSSSGDLNATDIGGDCAVRSVSGDGAVRNAPGNVTFAATSGGLSVRNIGRDIRVSTLSGDVEIECAKGRVEATCVSGSITLVGVGGDVEAKTTGGDISFVGALQANGRYALKALSGGVKMTIPSDTPGFQATLASYSGSVETHFQLAVNSSVDIGPINKRIIGRFGDGQIQLTLDSFSGSVRLLKSSSIPNCQEKK